MLHLSIDVVSKINQMQAMVPDYGKVRCDDNVMENIFSLTNLVSRYRVACDSHKDDPVTVKTTRDIIKFR